MRMIQWPTRLQTTDVHSLRLGLKDSLIPLHNFLERGIIQTPSERDEELTPRYHCKNDQQKQVLSWGPRGHSQYHFPDSGLIMYLA
jgi:hypothetical protein